MSDIDTSELNENFPSRGVNNDTQGFRDNFYSIKKNLDYAKKELEELNSSTIKLGTDNDFEGNLIQNANFVGCTEMYIEGDILLDNFTVDVSIGSYQSYTIDDNILISVGNWPHGRYAKVTLELTGETNSSKTVSFRDALFEDRIRYDDNWPNSDTNYQLSIDRNNTHVIEFWSVNGGQTVFSKYIGRF